MVILFLIYRKKMTKIEKKIKKEEAQTPREVWIMRTKIKTLEDLRLPVTEENLRKIQINTGWETIE